MIDEKLINTWVEKGTVTKDQAEIMLSDIAVKKKDTGMNKIVLIISIIGSVFIGLSVIFFVASNWEFIPITIADWQWLTQLPPCRPVPLWSRAP